MLSFSSPTALRVSVGLASLVVILITPLFLVSLPPLLDYPIHLARSYIALNYSLDEHLSAIYQIEWTPIPNLACDIIIYLLGNVLEIDVAGRVFLGLCLCFTVSGVVVLNRTIYCEWSYWPLIASIPAYHGALAAGFINYSMGVSLIPFAIAAWIAFESRSYLSRIFTYITVTLVLYFCHIMSVGIFGILIGVHTLWRIKYSEHVRTPNWRFLQELTLLSIPFLISMWLYLDYSLAEVAGREGSVIFGSWELAPKVRGLMMPVLSYDLVVDSLAMIILLGLPLALACFRLLDFHRGLASGLAIIFVLFLVLPGQILDASFIMDRLSIVLVTIGIGITQPRITKPFLMRSVFAVVVVLVITRSGIVALNWIESSDYHRRTYLMADFIQRGSSVLMVSPFSKPEINAMSLWRHRFLQYPDWHYSLINIPNLHALPIMSLIERSTFSQLHFVWPDKQILSLREAYHKFDEGDGGTSTASPSVILRVDRHGDRVIDLSDIPFDYVLILYVNHLDREFLSQVDKHSPLYADADMILLRAKFPEAKTHAHRYDDEPY